jgi:hypothetical protein
MGGYWEIPGAALFFSYRRQYVAKINEPAVQIADEGVPLVEPVVANVDLRALVSSEAFMNEPVTIRLHETSDENLQQVAVLNCNGVNQPVARGTTVTIKRKFIEILARMKETKYTQRMLNPSEPDRMEMVPRSGLVYPFEVLEDKNPKGREWVSHILAEPA